MFITQIFFNGIPLDLYPDKKIKYNIQANDIAEIKDRQASYTNSYSIPRTSRNIQILGGLGVPSDTSPYPYQKPNCMVCIDGFPIMVKGWLNIKSTDDEYKIYIYAGVIDFFKSIENKTLGADLDLSEINHNKNLASVIASFTNPYYRYLITDYNGLTHYGSGGDTINIDYLVPSVNVKYLWDKIHSTFNFTYFGALFDNPKFTNLWITYPKAVPVDNTELKEDASGTQFVGNVNVPTDNPNNWYRQLNSADLVDNKEFIAPETGDYKIVFEADITIPDYNDGFMLNYYASVNQENVPMSERVSIPLGSFPRKSQHVRTETIVNLIQGDIMSFYSMLWLSNGGINWTTNFNIKIYKFIGGSVSFSDELKAFKITDFISEILNVFGLTPFTDEHSRRIDYMLMSERLVSAEVEDWTDKYMGRTNEMYVYNSYAQRNVFSYQYNDKEGDYNNGSIIINNLNLKESTDVFKSKMYSPEKVPVQFYFGSFGFKSMQVFKLYDKEIKENGSTQTINYKGLDKRFHLVKANSINTTVKIGSQTFGISQTVASVPFADFTGLTWPEIINTFYIDYGKVLNDSRLHTINLYLHPLDVITLDLKKLYYFAQEQQYYLINKITYDGDDTTKGEFVRVKWDPNGVIIPTDPIDPVDYSLSIVWGDNSNLDQIGVASSIELKIAGMSNPADDPLITFDWQVDTGTGFVSLGSGANPFTAPVAVGNNSFRMQGISQNGFIVYSNTLKYNRIVLTCKEYECSQFLASGDSMQIYWIDCSNVAQSYVFNGTSPGSTHTHTVCASEGSISSSATINELGDCT
jgi:hypothetical protein